MATDNFTDADGTALATHDPKWTAAGGLSIMAEIMSNKCQPNGDWAVSAQYYNNSQPADQESQVVFVASTALRMVRRVNVRMSATVLGYGAHLTGTGSNYTTVELEKNGAWLATLTTGGSWPWNANHTVRIVVSGTSPAAISVYVDGSQVGSTYNDSSSPYTTGFPGKYTEGDGTRENAFDDWTDNAGVPNTWTLYDSLPVSVAMTFADAAAAWANHDWLVGLGMIQAAEGGGGSALTLDLADTLTFSDAVVKDIVQSLMDAVTFSDGVAKAVETFPADTLALSDAITGKDYGMSLADSMTFVDELVKDYGMSLADAISFVDSPTFQLNPGAAMARLRMLTGLGE